MALGTFERAIDLKISRFSEFPNAYEKAVASGQIDPAHQHIVTFCTGGIRCEKAALYLAEQGAASVTQVDGGILKYFETVGGRHWTGECFRVRRSGCTRCQPVTHANRAVLRLPVRRQCRTTDGCALCVGRVMPAFAQLRIKL